MKITQRLILLFLFVTLSFSAFIYTFFQIKKQESDLLSQADVLQRRQIINAFIDIKKYNLMQNLEKFSISDPISQFARYHQTSVSVPELNRLVADSELDIVQVYDSTGVQILSTASPVEPALAKLMFPDSLFSLLDKERIKYFTEPWNQQFMQIGAATIHAAADTTRSSDPVGYIVIGRLWDSAFLEDFSQTLDYNVRIYLAEPSIQTDHPSFNINIIQPLKGWNSTPVAWLRFRASNPFIAQLQSLGKHIIYGILFFILAFLLLQFALLYNWINAPLKLISLSLRKGNPELIQPLSDNHNEFGGIARLIKRFFEQNHQLRNEMEERRKTEMLLRQAQKMESIGTLAGGIAHDFNNLITIISGYIALASGKLTHDKEIHSNLEESMRACQRAKSVIEKILTFSRQTDKTVKPVHLAVVVKETIDLLRASIPTSISIETELASDAYVLADPTEIQQVVLNIATNSYHAMRYQGGLLRFELSDIDGSAVHYLIPAADGRFDYVCLSISDTGAGIPQEALERIFDPYYSTKAPGEGTGLGLSIVHGIVTSCSGYIHISSIINNGTTLKVFFPCTTLRDTANEGSEPDTAFAPARILFVDDEAALADLFAETLTEAGYRVTSFSDSSLAWEHFQTHSSAFDLMIADIAMPRINGINLSGKVLTLCPNLPIILYTGFSDATIQKNCRELGIKRLLIKPIMPADLAKIIRQVIHSDTDNN